MDSAQLISMVTLALPAGVSSGDRTPMATNYLNLAIGRVGRLPDVDFNKFMVPITLKTGVSEYQIGVDILQQDNKTGAIQELWHTDQQCPPIRVLNPDTFNDFAAGGRQTGRPSIATIHSNNKKMMVYPIPDKDYVVKIYYQMMVDTIGMIPTQYADVLYAVAITLINSATNPVVAAQQATLGLREVQNGSIRQWSGSSVEPTRIIQGNGPGSKRSTSYNLTGE
jgi:hypothetical protein